MAEGRKNHAAEKNEVTVWTNSLFFLGLQDTSNTDAF
jgi:hypothetical protein